MFAFRHKKSQSALARQSLNDASSAPATDQSGNRIALTAVTFATGLAFAGWTVLGPLGPGLQQNLRIDDARLGLLMALPVLIGSVLRLPVGLLADRFGGRRTLVALLGVTPLPLVLMGMNHDSYSALLVSAVLLGIAGSSFAAGVRFVEARFPQRRHGFALGVYGVAVAGTVATALVMPRLAQRYGLTTAFYVLAGAAVASWAIFVGFTRSAPGARARAQTARSLPPMARAPELFSPALFYAVAFGGFIACFAYLPKLLVTTVGMSPTTGATWAAGFAALSVGARVAAGSLSDRLGPSPVLKTSFAMVVVASLGIAAGYRHDATLLFSFGVLGLSFGAAAGATMKLLAQRFDAELGGAAGVVGAAGGFGGFVPPLLLATMVSSDGGYGLPFLGLGVMACVCLVIAWRDGPQREFANEVSRMRLAEKFP